jgi:hypothetical protein
VAWLGAPSLNSSVPFRLLTRSGVLIAEGIVGDVCVSARLATASKALATRTAKDWTDRFIDSSPCSSVDRFDAKDVPQHIKAD